MVILDLVRAVATLSAGQTAEVAATSHDLDTIRQWCERTGNTLVRDGFDRSGRGSVAVRRGRVPDPQFALGPDRVPGARLWLYTNFHCNLHCDYCCVASSPRAPRRELGAERIARLVAEAADWGASQVFLTGGEPFLLPDIDRIVRDCTSRLPTVLLTNGMLFRGPGLAALQAMPRDRFALQISLDSASPQAHDTHRGSGSWAKAVSGIKLALAAGFRVRVAATIAEAHPDTITALHTFLDNLGIPRDDQLIRPVARQGAATSGVLISRESLVPEITVTADGIFWHPVAAADERLLVRREIEPLRPALDQIYRLFCDRWAHTQSKVTLFPCA
jgi:sulfatase maturation enzyme AslB (radical SAM superfamily)